MVLCNSLINTPDNTEIIELFRLSFLLNYRKTIAINDKHVMIFINNYFRPLLIVVLVCSPSFMRAHEPDAISSFPRISWAIMPQLNLNMLGNWKTLKSNDVKISYGGGIGINCKILLKSDWLINTGVSICFDNLHISESYISPGSVNLERWTAPVSISLGHSFSILEDVNIIPLVSAEAAYCFSNKIKVTDDMDDCKWNRFNISWGIGCGLEFDHKYEIDFLGYFGLLHLIRQFNTDVYDNKVRVSFKYFF